MTPEEYEWHLNFIKERYQYLNLTSEQAGKIYLYEKDKDLYSHKVPFNSLGRMGL